MAAPPVAPGVAPAGDWWLAAGDPVLARVITQGLSGSTALACDAAGLAPIRRRGIAGWHRLKTDTAEAGYRYADHRARVAAAIAHAYVDVRKWQALLALRTGVLAQYRDNAEIARFRREAGLVSAIDGGLAGALSAQDDSTQTRTQARLDAGFEAVANLTGVPADDLKSQLSESANVPDLGPAPSPASAIAARADLLAMQSHLERRLRHANVSQASLDRAMADPVDTQSDLFAQTTAPAQLAVAQWRHAFTAAETEIRTLAAAVAVADGQLQSLPLRAATAQRVVADARLAYRAGVGDFASLFVAEVAALGLREALVEAQADRAGAMIDLRTARGEGWSRADLAPATTAVRRADCE